MEETLEGGRGPPQAVEPLERERGREREREYLLKRKLSWPQQPLRKFGENRNFLALWEFKCGIVQPVA